MPLSDDASLFTPYTVWFIPNRERDLWVVCQREPGSDEDIAYISPIEWPTKEEAEQHAQDLNFLREKTLLSMTTTNLWVSIDIADDGPDVMTILEQTLVGDRIFGWRLLNPAADDDHKAWEAARTSVQNTLDALTQEELPEDPESLFEHLRGPKHGFDFDAVPEQPESWYVKYHREVHDKGYDGDTHTHEWHNEEVTDDGSDEEEGAREDADS
jgi:hypothetical protein